MAEALAAPATPSSGSSSGATSGSSSGSSRLVAARALVALSVALVGFLLAAQFRAQQGVTEQLEAESEQDLTRIFSALNAESAALRDEISDLRLELAALESSAARDELARQAAERQLEELEILAGLVAAKGPGVTVRIDDPSGAFEFEMLLDLVQELRDAGAEAIAVNGRRIGASTPFSSRRGLVTVDGKEILSPYEVVAIGDPATLEVGLRIPGGAVDTLDALERAEVEVERSSEVRVPALEHTPTFRVAHPVE